MTQLSYVGITTNGIHAYITAGLEQRASKPSLLISRLVACHLLQRLGFGLVRDGDDEAP